MRERGALALKSRKSIRRASKEDANGHESKQSDENQQPYDASIFNIDPAFNAVEPKDFKKAPKKAAAKMVLKLELEKMKVCVVDQSTTILELYAYAKHLFSKELRELAHDTVFALTRTDTIGVAWKPKPTDTIGSQKLMDRATLRIKLKRV